MQLVENELLHFLKGISADTHNTNTDANTNTNTNTHTNTHSPEAYLI